MAKTINAKVPTSLIDACKIVGKEFAEDIKKKYNLRELFVPNTLALELIAGKIMTNKKFPVKIHKVSRDSAILELL
jgi:hypothetical protein